MEPQAALVGSNGAVELDTVAVVDLHLPLVIYPGHPEQNDTLGGSQPFQQRIFPKGILVLFNDGGKRFQNLGDSLDKFRLIGILLLYALQHFINIAHGSSTPLYSSFIRQENIAHTKHKCSSSAY